MTMEFESDILGEFSELFRFILRGNEEPVPCQFKGHVVSHPFIPHPDFSAFSMLLSNPVSANHKTSAIYLLLCGTYSWCDSAQTINLNLRPTRS